MNPIEKAIQIAGSQAALARAIGAKSGVNIHHWRKANKVPAEWCAAIERATGGAITRYDLRPDVFGSAVPQKPPGTAKRRRSRTDTHAE